MVLILTGVDLEQGLANAQRAAAMLRSTGDSLGHAWALVNVAMAQGVCDRFDAARTAYEEFLTAPNAGEHPRLRTWAELAAAWTELVVGSPERAREHAELGLELEGPWPSMTHFILTGFRVHALALLGRPEAAAALGMQTLVKVQESGAAMAGPAIEMALAIAELMGGHLEQADAQARRLLDMPQVHTVALMRETLALIALARGDGGEARVHGRELAALGQKSGSLRHLAVADFLQGRAALFDGDADHGRDLIQAALAGYTELGIERGAADALEELGLLAASNGDGRARPVSSPRPRPLAPASTTPRCHRVGCACRRRARSWLSDTGLLCGTAPGAKDRRWPWATPSPTRGGHAAREGAPPPAGRA
jgi:hypothetical protein